jgi:feruloyl-CoA synthase
VLASPAVRSMFARLLDGLNAGASGSSTRIEHLLPLAEPPSIDHREMTDKGSINQAAVLARRAALVEDLYASRAALAIRHEANNEANNEAKGERATT